MVVLGRRCSSLANATEPSGFKMGTMLRSKRPSSWARAARFWLSKARASTSSRVKPSMVAMRSADTPWGTKGYIARRAALPTVKSGGPLGAGQRDMDSTPPATTTSWCPACTAMAAHDTAC
ncbi:unannotated protein [freshwater metagenome]|uniref:Unannotated protein n=1 Tax=freshwater metagenome TaxID=449393 RepID=A0A6J6FFP5_9ZZZZ